MSGVLLLEDGRRFQGAAFGASGLRVGEVVFNTAMTGYQEVLTDPSYCEQIVAMTAPHIGNTGVNAQDPESDRVWVSGFVAREFSRHPSSWRAEGDLDGALKAAGVPAIEGIDTRALVRHIRSKGAMKAAICTDGSPDSVLRDAIAAWPGMSGRALAGETAEGRTYIHHDPAGTSGQVPRARVTVVDGGSKRNILRLLEQANCRVRVAPITATAEEWLEDSDLLLFSNGPGDPAALTDAIDQIRAAVGKKPLVGICLGHQLLGLALGAKTYKLRFGHRGANHPVRDLETGRVEITSQNHGFCVEASGLVAAGATVTHHNLNDDTVAGFRHDDKRVMAVQFHPEAGPGPHDSNHLVVDRFLKFSGF